MKLRVDANGFFKSDDTRLRSLTFCADEECVDLWLEVSDGKGYVAEGAVFLTPGEARAIARGLLRCARKPAERIRRRLRKGDPDE